MIDKETELQEIKKTNCNIKAVVIDREKEIDELNKKVERLQREVRRARNELCDRCGKHRNAHLGACDGCRYRFGGEWSADVDDD